MLKTQIRYIVFGCLNVLLFGACSNQDNRLIEMKKVEAVMTAHPDSALFLLNQIPSTESLKGEAQATYCLLLTQALDKNYIEHTTDSIINIAVNYFRTQSDPLRKAQSYYYLGRVYSDLYLAEEAMQSYLRAAGYAEETLDYSLKGLIANHLGMLYYQTNQYADAILYYKKAYKDYLAIKDTMKISFVLRDIGRAYNGLGKMDSVAAYYHAALAMAVKQPGGSSVSGIYGNLANFYEQKKEYELALENGYRSVEWAKDKEDRSVGYFVIGSIFNELNKLDSATIYLQKALCSDNLYTVSGSYELLSQIYAAQEDWKLSQNFLSKSVEYRDSIETIYKLPEIKKMEVINNYQKRQIETANLKAKKQQNTFKLFIIVFIGVIALIIMYFINRKRLRLQEERYLPIINGNECTIKQLENSLEEQKRIQSEETESHRRNIQQLQESIEQMKVRNKVLSKKLSSWTTWVLENKETAESIAKFPKNKFLSETAQAELYMIIRKVAPKFLAKLKRRAPTLTEKDTLLCCCLRLNFTNEEIASCLGISSASVSRYKSKIVKERFEREGGISLKDLLDEL